jgi:hypothetical protein
MWEYSLTDGVAPGMLTNWTQDLLFSMERLSNNPYIVQRVHPKKKDISLPFEMESGLSENLTTISLTQFHYTGRLFVAKHSIQAGYITNPER